MKLPYVESDPWLAKVCILSYDISNIGSQAEVFYITYYFIPLTGVLLMLYHLAMALPCGLYFIALLLFSRLLFT